MKTAVYNFVHNFSLKCVRVFGVFFIFATQLNNMERVKTNTDEILSRICAITPSDVVGYCEGKPYVGKLYDYDHIRETFTKSGEMHMMLNDIWHLPFYVRKYGGYCEGKRRFTHSIKQVANDKSIALAGEFEKYISKNELRRLKNSNKQELVRFLIKRFGENMLFKISYDCFVAVLEVKSPDDYKKNKSVELFFSKQRENECQRQIRDLETKISDIGKNLAKTRERTKTLEDYERVRTYRYEGLPKYICFGNAKDIEGKTCECYPARGGCRGWKIAVFSLVDGLDGFADYLKNKLSGMPDKNGVWDVWLVTGGDKTSVGVGTYMVKDVVPVENLSQQIKTKGVESLFWNIR